MQATALLSRWQQLPNERRRHVMLALLGTALSWVAAGLMATHRGSDAGAPQAMDSQVVRSADASQSIQQTQPVSATPAQP